MARNEAELATALLQLWRKEEADLRQRLIDQENALNATKEELEILRRGMEALAARAGDEAAAELEDEAVDQSVDWEDQGGDADLGRAPTRRKTPAIVVEILKEHGKPLTREEIYAEFQRQGLTKGYSRPLNAVTTAVRRAHERGWIVEVDRIAGRYGLPSSTGEGVIS